MWYGGGFIGVMCGGFFCGYGVVYVGVMNFVGFIFIIFNEKCIVF